MKEDWVFMTCFSYFSRFCLILDHRGRLGGLREKVGSACEEFEDTESEGGILGYCF